MPRTRVRKPRPPLDPSSLDELALAYVGRFATTRAKLRAYLHRKLRERGWQDAGSGADVDGLVERFARSGLVDDEAFALAKAQTLARRGYGVNRVGAALRAAGVEEDDREGAMREAGEGAFAAAMRFAERRRFGPFAAERITDLRQREKQLAAMVRAGHPLGLALTILKLEPGDFRISRD